MTSLLVWLLAVLSASAVFGTSPLGPSPFQRRPRPPPRPPRPSHRPGPSNTTYFISAPNTVIPGTVYTVTVDILNGTDVEVTAGFQETVYNKTKQSFELNDLQDATGVFSKGRAGRLSIPIESSFECTSCKLVVKGRGGQVFERAKSVFVKTDIVSIFVQTDKAIYKPGQRVRYRAFAAYQDLLLYKGAMSIEIREPSGNRMQVQTGLRDPSGVVEGFLNLSDQPPFGDWKIIVNAEGEDQRETQTFTVAQYELPRFEVTVDLPPFALVHETAIRGTVKAKYTYGKPVKGMVELHAGPDQGPDYCGRMPNTVSIGFQIDGEGTFTMEKANINRVLSISHGTRVRFTAIVKEEATGVKLNGSSVIQYHTQLHSMSFLSSTPNVFKPGLPYTAHVQVKKPDGTPADESSTDITVWTYAESRTTVANQDKYGTSFFTATFPLSPLTLKLPANGIATFNIEIPSNATQIWIKAYYGSLSISKNIHKTYSPSNNYMQLTMRGSNIQSGDKTVFQVQATESLETINYEVISRQSVTAIDTLGVQGQSTFDFEVEITEDMGPVANLLVYYVRGDGEVVADSISFNVDGIFKNKVSLDFSAERAEPNTNIKLNVKADPMSKVYLLAVDESVLLLKSGNDISTSKVQNGISSTAQMDSEHAQSHSATNIRQVFTQSGLVVITDALPGDRQPRPSFGRPGLNYGGSRPVFYQPGLEDDSSRFSDYGYRAMTTSRPAQMMRKEVRRVRNVFPEAWLWADVVTTADGTYVVNTTVPDTITSWVASAFATNERTGLGVTATKANVTVFRSFFVTLNYPSSIKRNEKAVVQATVFNYLQSPVYVQVNLKDTTGFQHVQIQGETESIVDSAQPQSFWVRPDSNGVAYFPIVGKEVGVFDIEVKAQSSLAADGVRRQINIEPEGAPVSYNHALYLDQGSTSVYTESVSITFPETTVPGSKKISVGLSGDLIGPSFSNIGHLLEIPTGCGEQNMIRLAPTLYIAQYLKSSGQLTPERREDIVERLSSGYQSQLTYRRSDASFSAFGNFDESGSTWLTAYVSRVLSEAREFTYVDPNVLINAVDWLVDRQRDDGAFVELGRVIDPATQGKSTGPALTAYVLLTLNQNKDLVSARKCENDGKNCARTWKWNNATNKAIENLSNSIDGIQDSFSMSLVSYALTQVRGRNHYRAFRKMKGMAKTEGGLTCWEGNSTLQDTTPVPRYRDFLWRPPRPRARPIDTLITSYALMAYTARGQVRQALPIVRCLTQKKNFMGGFGSTQDTSVGLQALSAFATRAYDPDNELTVTFELLGADTIRLDIDRNNMLNYQTREFQQPEADMEQYDVELKAFSRGTGTAVAEINYSFHTLEMPDSEAFDVSTVLLDDNFNNFNLMICTKWLKGEHTGMVVQEIEIPSGFEPDLGTIGRVAGMKRYERRGNTAVVYFDEIVRQSTCYSLLMSRKSKVAQTEKTFVHTFNYYNPGDSSTVFYHPRKLKTSTVCDVCPKCCNPES